MVAVRRVTLTQQNDVQAVVAAGLQAGERVVTTGFARLTEGTAVTASSAEDAGQLAPHDRPRPDGTRGKRVEKRGEQGKRHPSSGAATVTSP
jgi:multidrug efflux system membrane fusion protein